MDTAGIIVIVILGILVAAVAIYLIVIRLKTGKFGLTLGGGPGNNPGNVPPPDPYQKVYIVEPNNDTYIAKTLNGTVLAGYTATPIAGDVYHVRDNNNQMVGSGYLTREAAWESHVENVYTYVLQESITDRLNDAGIDIGDGYIVIRYVDQNGQLLRAEARDSDHITMDGYIDENGRPIAEGLVQVFTVTEYYDTDGCISNEMPQ